MSNVILPNLGAVNRLITDASPQPTLFSTLYSLGLTIKTDHLTNEMFDSPNPRAERLPTPAPAPRIPTYPRPSAPGAYQARELRGSRPRDGGNLDRCIQLPLRIETWTWISNTILPKQR